MKATARAPANIAFVKYWGKTDEELRLPMNSSISMNLSNCLTTTTVEFSKSFTQDKFYILSSENMDNYCRSALIVSGKEAERVIKHLDRIRQIVKTEMRAKVLTQNSFPKGTGIASSASGFAALTLAAVSALGIKISEKKLSILVRLGSGSAARSIPDGFVEWKTGKGSNYSYAYSLYNEKYWDLRDIILIISDKDKKIGSTLGQENAESSIFLKSRLKNLPTKIQQLKNALREKDFKSFGKIVEEEAIELHTIMMTQKPPLYYWNGATMDIIQKIQEWRTQGLLVYFTLDAGPNVHLICEGDKEKEILSRIKNINSVKNVIINTPAKGARLTDKHLF